jgi:hypothetical protein
MFGFVIDRTTQCVGAFFCSSRVTLADDAFFALGFDHLNAKL